MVGGRIGIGVIGTGQRGYAFARFLAEENEAAALVALCDLDPRRLKSVAAMLGVNHLLLETNYAKLLSSPDVDAVVIATPDHAHEEMTIAALDAGKHVFLEKPMATTLEACARIAARAAAHERVFQLGYVLQYAPFYEKVHELVASGELGQVVLIEAKEIVGYRHGASYLRRWHRSRAKSGGLLLTKCCHDLDVLNWLSGSAAAKVASFGGVSWFRPDPAKPARCRDCSEECLWRFDPRDAFILITPEEQEELSQTDADLCVFNADKDIVDHQMAIIEYENGIKASFSVSLFGPRETRLLFISGTRGRLAGDFGRGEITLARLGRSEEVAIRVESHGGGHAGADRKAWRDFIRHVMDGSLPPAGAKEGFESAILALAADDSMAQHKVIDLKALRRRFLEKAGSYGAR